MNTSPTRRLIASMAAQALLCLACLGFGASVAIGQEEGPRSAYFGDLHIHTMFSHDAFALGTRTTPDDAYLFAKGEPIPHTSGTVHRLSGPSLDFLAVTDHASYLGIFPALQDPSSPICDHPAKAQVLPREGPAWRPCWPPVSGL